jgi:predicted DsbA family dithiol-disulfide isomerase
VAGAGLGVGARPPRPYYAGRVQIDVWSDYACPWCALGLARLRAALAEFEHGDEVAVVHRAFELAPHAPARIELSQDELLARKYGLSPARVRAGHARLTALGAEVGVAFDFERVRAGNTFDAHRLTRTVRGTAPEDALVAGLFAAHFGEGRLLSDHDVLRDVAQSAGVPDDLTEKVLAGTLGSVEVRADEAAATERDVTGVPYFLIDDAWPVPGAQDVETLGLVLRRAWSRFGH